MRKFASFAVSVILASSISVSAFALDKTVPFIDIANNSWYYSYISDVYKKGIISGTSENIFEPDVTLTRGMAASLIYRMYGSPDIKYSKYFSDVADGEWYTDGITWAKDNGIISGYDDGTFSPDWAMTVEQFASVLYRLAGKPEIGNSNALSKYSDNFMVSSYAKQAMIWASEKGMLAGDTLHPTSAITRAEAAKMLSIFTETYDYKAINNMGEISSYIKENYDSTFDMTDYSYSSDSDGNIYLAYMVGEYKSTFGYCAVMSGDKLMRVEMIGKMNPYFLSSDIKEPKYISDDELFKIALESYDTECSVYEKNITRYFNMSTLKFVFDVEITYVDDNGAYFTNLFRYEI